MDLGGSSFKEVLEPRLIFSDFETAKSKSEANSNSSFTKSRTCLDGKNANHSKNGVYDLLECPVCKNLMYPPIHQCPNGHTLCSNCKITVHNRCPTCHRDLGNIRCLALEKVAESMELPCRYQNLGCHDIFPYHSKLKHEQNCRFRPYSCPYAGSECSMMCDIQALMNHLKDDHKVDVHDGFTFNHRYVKSNPHEVENATWMLTVFNCFGKHFCLHFEAFLPRFIYKAKSDFVKTPILENGLEGIWSLFHEEGAKGAMMIWFPYGGIMDTISESEIPFPHRKGNLYHIHYQVDWQQEGDEVEKLHINWIRKLYNYMEPFVSKSPRAGYINYRDLDIGVNNIDGYTSYKQASIWGVKYFKNNFRRLANVKTKVDPLNFFRNEQSIPSLVSKGHK